MDLWQSVLAERRSTKETFAEAGVFALQAAICAVLIVKGYAWLKADGAMWALISAALVLQPGFSQSLAASALRVIANLLGAGIGAAISLTLGYGLPEICLGLVAIILACEFMRLDKGVRSACASLLIVMMKTDDTVLHRSLERVIAVAIGCGIALLLQIITQPIVEKAKKEKTPQTAG